MSLARKNVSQDSSRGAWVLTDLSHPFEQFREAVRDLWLGAGQPTLASISELTDLPEERVHAVLRARNVAPWNDVERVLRGIGVRNESALQQVRQQHMVAAEAEQAYPLRLRRPGVNPGIDVAEWTHDAVTRWIVESTRPQVDLSAVTTDALFLEELRRLKAAAGNISLRDLAHKMGTTDPRNAIAKTTIAKYFAKNSATMPRTQTVGQITLLLRVLLQAGEPPGQTVSPHVVEEYFRCWQRLITAPPTATPPTATPPTATMSFGLRLANGETIMSKTTTVPIVKAVNDKMLELSLHVDHEAELRKAAMPTIWSRVTRHSELAAIALLLLVVIVPLLFKF